MSDQSQSQLNQIDAKIYPENIWDYIEQYPDDLGYIPTPRDRSQLLELEDREKRTTIWDYFFQINPDDLGKSQKREIEKLEKQKQEKIYAYDQLQEFTKKLNSSGPQIQPIHIVIGGLLIGGYLVISRLIDYFRGFNSFIGIIAPLIYCSFPLILIGLGILYSYRYWGKQSTHREIKKYLRTLQTTKESINTQRLKDVLGNLDNEIKQIGEQTKLHLETIEARLDYLRSSIVHLKDQVPIPPNYEIIQTWLDEDLKRLEQTSLENTEMENRLPEIIIQDTTGDELKVSNPIAFISPGELQDPERIPPPYRPPQNTLLHKLGNSDQLKTLTNDNSMISSFFGSQVTHRLQPKPTPDKAKHLLARKVSSREGHYNILYGVYYVEYLLIGESMMALHGFFFDFITGKLTGEKITEQYYQDVVAIEQSKEYRTIPLRYDSINTLDIEDTPALSLTLGSGDRRVITFVNEDYLTGIMKELNRQEGSLYKSTTDSLHYITESVNEAKQNAIAAIKVLREHLRQHKGKQTS